MFYRRLAAFVRQRLVRDNFHFRFFFFGLQRLDEATLPPGYREAYYEPLRAALPKLQIVTAEAVSYLLSAEGVSVTKAALSNIFEYTSQADFQASIEALVSPTGWSPTGQFRTGHSLRLAFWNLLNDQGSQSEFDAYRDEKLSARAMRQETCFYFGSTQVFNLL